jgi:CheY-like chemotaxis protein
MSKTSGGPLLLLVDDHVDTLELYAIEMRLLGFQVITASDARTAIRKAVEMRPAAVIMDVVMPAMDGCEATRHIKAALGRVPVVAVTATPSLLAMEERTLFEAVLGKPCPTQLMADTLRRLIGGQAAQMPDPGSR